MKMSETTIKKEKPDADDFDQDNQPIPRRAECAYGLEDTESIKSGSDNQSNTDYLSSISAEEMDVNSGDEAELENLLGELDTGLNKECSVTRKTSITSADVKHFKRSRSHSPSEDNSIQSITSNLGVEPKPEPDGESVINKIPADIQGEQDLDELEMERLLTGPDEMSSTADKNTPALTQVPSNSPDLPVKLKTEPSDHTATETGQSAAELERELALGEMEIERLLKAEEESPSFTNQDASGTSEVHVLASFPNPIPMDTPQMPMLMPDQPYAFDTGLSQPYFFGNMGPAQMMSYGMQQMEVPEVREDELQCLPVTRERTDFGMPAFKRIKLEAPVQPTTAEKERETSDEDTVADPRNKIFELCQDLFDKLKYSEQPDAFRYTPTVTKAVTSKPSNSVLHKITNVTYDFQSIGPKLNLTDWGLQSIPPANTEIAKFLGISADTYFTKISEKANTAARNLVQVKNNKANDDEQMDTDAEVEEPTLSTFVKHTMTQTNPLVCQECVARKRIQKLNFSTQTICNKSSIDSQTTPDLDPHFKMVTGLNKTQLMALYNFSNLFREPAKTTPAEVQKLQDLMLAIYNVGHQISNRRRQSSNPSQPVMSFHPQSMAPVAPYSQSGAPSRSSYSNHQPTYINPANLMNPTNVIDQRSYTDPRFKKSHATPVDPRSSTDSRYYAQYQGQSQPHTYTQTVRNYPAYHPGPVHSHRMEPEPLQEPAHRGDQRYPGDELSEAKKRGYGRGSR